MTTALKITKRRDGQIEVNGGLLDTRCWRSVSASDVGEPISLENTFEHLGDAGLLRGLVVGIIGPRAMPEKHLAALAGISRVLRNDATRAALLRVSSDEEAFRLLTRG